MTAHPIRFKCTCESSSEDQSPGRNSWEWLPNLARPQNRVKQTTLPLSTDDRLPVIYIHVLVQLGSHVNGIGAATHFILI